MFEPVSRTPSMKPGRYNVFLVLNSKGPATEGNLCIADTKQSLHSAVTLAKQVEHFFKAHNWKCLCVLLQEKASEFFNPFNQEWPVPQGLKDYT